MDPKSNDKCFIEDRPEEYADTWRWWSCEDGGRDWADVATSQRMPRALGNCQKLGRDKGGFQRLKGIWPCQDLGLRLLAAKIVRE